MEASLRPRSAPSTRPILLSCTHGVRRTTWISNPVLFNVLCLKPATACLVKSKASRQRITKNLNDIPHPGRIRMPEVEHHIELVLINDRELYSATIRNVVLSTTSVLKVRTFLTGTIPLPRAQVSAHLSLRSGVASPVIRDIFSLPYSYRKNVIPEGRHRRFDAPCRE